MKRFLVLLAAMLAVFSVFSTAVFADGMAHYYHDNMWNLHPEKQQVAAIYFKDGYENLLVSVDLDSEVRGEKAVWIFPVPAEPGKVAIDIFKGFPNFGGQDIDSQYKSAVWGAAAIMGIYSVMPLVGPLAILGTVGYVDFSASGARKQNEVTIHESIQEMGVTTELITTKSQEALTQYLQGKGLDLPEKSKAIINEYVGKEYSFVVSYISDLEEFRLESQTDQTSKPFYYPGESTPIGIFVKFPTEKIYFPLKPTSVYESAEIPITLFVVGHVSPNISDQVKPLSKTTYYHQNYYYNSSSGDSAAFFNNQDIKDFDYTMIEITSPSKYLTEDLWIENYAPVSVGLKGFVSANILWFGILWFLALCAVSSIIAGRIALKNPALPDKKLAMHGLWNILTIIGFVIASTYLKTKTLDPKIEAELKAKNISVRVNDPGKALYAFLFYAFFIGLAIVSAWVLAAI
ncbi:MAG: hypothetical protein NT067_01365 [Candidatus Diapherotrites archaeon]|nr:hypothetical protein [Candidatus Diapherotrites archaeon]